MVVVQSYLDKGTDVDASTVNVMAQMDVDGSLPIVITGTIHSSIAVGIPMEATILAAKTGYKAGCAGRNSAMKHFTVVRLTSKLARQLMAH